MSTAIGVSLPRLATAVGKAVSEYAVLGKTPGFTADFIKNKYPSYSSFASAITHARSTNATMTDGYGPELVTNGGFDSGTDGWTTSGNVTVEDSVATLDGSSVTLLWQSILTIGKMYEVNFNVVSVGGGNLELIDNSGTVYDTFNTTGPKKLLIEASGSNSNLIWRTRNNAIASIDNVSVRKMPVLKWAPHNLLTYSEDFSQSQWNKSNATVSGQEVTVTTASAVNVLYQILSTVAGQYRLEAEVKAGTTDSLGLKLTDQGTASHTVTVDLTAETISASAGTTTDRSIEDIGDGWYLIGFNANIPAAGTDTVYFTEGATAFGSGDTFFTRNVRFYRSDLGGMAANPDQPPSRTSYVPTTSTAVYLPRIGHHVYNGNAWVNEGLLAESEARTNGLTYSNELTNAAWTKNVTVTEVDDKYGFTLFKLAQAGTGSFTNIQQAGPTVADDGYVTLSAYVKAGTSPETAIRIQDTGNTERCTQPISWTNGVPSFDTEVDTTNLQLQERTIQDVGDGLYRVSITVQNTTGASIGTVMYNYNQWTGTSDSPDSYVGAIQAELGATPSSFIPTDSATVTRAAETFTIPSANLPWPSPSYIGDNVVTNGTFDTDSDWTKGTGWTISGGTASSDGTQTAISNLQQDASITNGNVYAITYTLSSVTAGNLKVFVGSGASGDLRSSNGTYTDYIVASGAAARIYLQADANFVGSIDNVSVREINPLSVSIAMDGRMTYADDDTYSTVVWHRWYADGNNYLIHRVDTALTQTGHQVAHQRLNGVDDYSTGNPPNTMFSPDVLVPFDVAVRSGSTFVQVASDGLTPTANTTPTGLPDLSAADLNLAHDYMGTVGTFRVWDKDLGETGIVEATNPSLEPSLSLTFEGTGTNSFVVNDWSE